MVMNNFVDISGNLLKNSSWNGMLLFWGVVAPTKSGIHQPLKWCCPRLWSGRWWLYNRLVWAKDYHNRLLAVLRTPRLPVGGFKFKVFIFLQVVKTVGLTAVLYCFRPLCFNLKGKILMSIIETKSTNRKAIILLFSNDLHDEIKQKKLTNCCSHNNLEIIKTIKTNRNYDPNIFCKLIDIIKEHDQPITIVIDEYSYATYSQVMTCCVLGTLAMTKIVNICTYWELTETKEFRLHFNKEPFNFLLVAEEFLAQLLFMAKKESVKDAIYKKNGGK